MLSTTLPALLKTRNFLEGQKVSGVYPETELSGVTRKFELL
jgi:hypothetical protein